MAKNRDEILKELGTTIETELKKDAVIKPQPGALGFSAWTEDRDIIAEEITNEVIAALQKEKNLTSEILTRDKSKIIDNVVNAVKGSKENIDIFLETTPSATVSDRLEKIRNSIHQPIFRRNESGEREDIPLNIIGDIVKESISKVKAESLGEHYQRLSKVHEELKKTVSANKIEALAKNKMFADLVKKKQAEEAAKAGAPALALTAEALRKGAGKAPSVRSLDADEYGRDSQTSSVSSGVSSNSRSSGTSVGSKHSTTEENIRAAMEGSEMRSRFSEFNPSTALESILKGKPMVFECGGDTIRAILEKGKYNIETGKKSGFFSEDINKFVHQEIEAKIGTELKRIEPKQEASGALKYYSQKSGGELSISPMAGSDGKFHLDGGDKFSGIARIERMDSNGNLMKGVTDIVEYKNGKPVMVIPATKGTSRIGNLGALEKIAGIHVAEEQGHTNRREHGVRVDEDAKSVAGSMVSKMSNPTHFENPGSSKSPSVVSSRSSLRSQHKSRRDGGRFQ